MLNQRQAQKDAHALTTGAPANLPRSRRLPIQQQALAFRRTTFPLQLAPIAQARHARHLYRDAFRRRLPRPRQAERRNNNKLLFLNTFYDNAGRNVKYNTVTRTEREQGVAVEPGIMQKCAALPFPLGHDQPRSLNRTGSAALFASGCFNPPTDTDCQVTPIAAIRK